MGITSKNKRAEMLIQNGEGVPFGVVGGSPSNVKESESGDLTVLPAYLKLIEI